MTRNQSVEIVVKPQTNKMLSSAAYKPYNKAVFAGHYDLKMVVFTIDFHFFITIYILLVYVYSVFTIFLY